MIDLVGKTLLIMDNTALGAAAVTRAKEMGVKTIVANFYPYERSKSKQVSDEYVDIDITKTDSVVKLIKEKNIDGVFVGWTDSHLPYYAEICEKANLPSCATKEQFEILSNNKHKFKQACIQYGVPTLKEYSLDIKFKKEDLEKIIYPVMVKPADGSGGRGVKKCNNEKELKDHYTSLYNNSHSKNIICEEYIDNADELFLNYTIQDGYYSLSASYINHEFGTFTLHTYTSKYIDLYKEKVETSIINMLKNIGVKNGVLSLQGFVVNDSFKFHETGLRMGGGQSYIFTKEFNGVSALDLMIEFALTGKMTSVDLKEKDDPKFPFCAVNYYIKTKSGEISSINGIEEIVSLPQVLQLSAFKGIGDKTDFSFSTDSIIFRIHVKDETEEQLARTLEKISKTIKIFSSSGNDLQAEPISYNRILPFLKKH